LIERALDVRGTQTRYQDVQMHTTIARTSDVSQPTIAALRQEMERHESIRDKPGRLSVAE